MAAKKTSYRNSICCIYDPVMPIGKSKKQFGHRCKISIALQSNRI